MLVTANIFQPLIDVFQSVLTFFHSSLGVSWGWSIVLLTICVRLVLLPLTVKQFESMRRMQHLQPQMKAIQQKYKDDKQRQQQEMMKFYRENDVNPLASCLPLAAQLPVFISLFYMLRKNLRTDICPDVQTRFQAHYATAHHIAATSSQALSQTTWCTYYRRTTRPAAFLFINDITNTAHGATLRAAAVALRRHAAAVDDADVGADDGQVAAADDDVHAADLRGLHHPLPGRLDRLLDHDQHLDDGAAVHAQATGGTAAGRRLRGDSRGWLRAVEVVAATAEAADAAAGAPADPAAAGWVVCERRAGARPWHRRFRVEGVRTASGDAGDAAATAPQEEEALRTQEVATMAMEDADETIDYVEEILETIAEAVGVDAEVRMEETDERIVAEFVGDDLAS